MVSVDLPTKSVTLETGEVLTADVIIGADGRDGLCRELLLGCQPAPKSTYTGMTVYKSVFVPLGSSNEVLTYLYLALSLRGIRSERTPSCPNS